MIIKIFVTFVTFVTFALTNLAQADLSNVDFSQAAGVALIDAPTSVTPSANGIWFYNPESYYYSLTLPQLPTDQYAYEAWVVDIETGVRLSVGKFSPIKNPGVDSDGPGPYAGDLILNFWRLPGSDFVKSEIDITDGKHKVEITVEPYPDTSKEPGNVLVLEGFIPKDAKKRSLILLLRP